MSRRRTTLLFFAAVFLMYLSMSPGAIGGMGYTMEEMTATRELFSKPAAFLTLDKTVKFSRNGPVALLFHAPFMAAGSLVSNNDPQWVDRLLAIEPVLFTALTVALLFAWLWRLTASPAWALILASTAAFATMLWPYAYIGLETVQSFFILLAGYLAMESNAPRTWPRTVLFAVTCALAISVKSTGTFAGPAILFVVWCYFRDDEARLIPRLTPKLIGVLVITGGLYLANSYYRSVYWQAFGGSANFIKLWLTSGPVSFVLNLVSFLFSANKGLIVFAPLTLIAFYYLPRAWKREWMIAAYALLVLGGLAGGFSLLRNWADETWGPRYLHSSIAPLVLCIGVIIRSERVGRGFKAAVALTAAAGFYVSLLGAFFYYGSVHGAQNLTSQPTLEGLQSDPVWNHIKFHDRLFEVWLDSDEPAPQKTWWTARHDWFFKPPVDAAPWKSVDLASFAHPQSSLIRSLEAVHRSPIDRIWLPIYLLAAIGGMAIFISIAVRIARTTAPAHESSRTLP